MSSLKINISKNELETLYLKEGLSDAQIGSKYGVSLGRVNRLRKRYGIRTLESYERHFKQELDEREKEIILGTLLGDGHLRWRGGKRTYPELMIEQSIKHEEYILWMRDELKDWLSNVNLKLNTKIRKRKEYQSYSIRTICHPVFIEFYNGFYNGDKKEVNIKFIKKYFSELSLAVWLMDDGSLSKGRNIALCSHSFSKSENEELSMFLSDRYGLESNLWRGGERYYLGFSKISSEKMSNILNKYLLPCMRHKVQL